MSVTEEYFTTLSDFPDRTANDELEAIKVLNSHLKGLKDSNYSTWFVKALELTDIGTEVTNVDDWLFVWRQALNEILSIKHRLERVGFEVLFTDKTRHIGTAKVKKFEKKTQSSQNSKPLPASITLVCTGCGRNRHLLETCRSKDSKFFNKTTAPFVGSAGHALLVSEFGPRTYIPSHAEFQALSEEDSLFRFFLLCF